MSKQTTHSEQESKRPSANEMIKERSIKYMSKDKALAAYVAVSAQLEATRRYLAAN